MPDSPTYSGLIVDWGGVLTTDINSSVRRWADRHAVDLSAYADIMRSWLGPEGELEAMVNPIHALERGEIEVPHFEETLARELSRRTEAAVQAPGLLARMFDEFEHAHDMNALVRRAREIGIRTALLSNSWGDFYPRDLWEGMFDVVVISGEVGMRKPDPAIFHLTLERMELGPGDCVFVDDLPHNIGAAADLGITGVRHVTYDQTLDELQALFGVDLA
ncbi:MAG: HAD family phosphatase [Actinobacteria bacterium]|nr:HAD family phosphatase [Actinomycetota bacterium]